MSKDLLDGAIPGELLKTTGGSEFFSMSGRKILTMIAGVCLFLFSFTICIGLGCLIAAGTLSAATIISLFALTIRPTETIVKAYFDKKKHSDDLPEAK